VDWSRVDGIDVQVAQTAIAAVGTDLEAFPSEKHFANWLGLCPTNETSGGKVLKRRTPKVRNRAKGGNIAVQKPKLSGSTVRPPANPIGSAQGHHRYGSQARLPVLPATDQSPANTWTEARNIIKRGTANSRFGPFSKKLTNSACKLFSQNDKSLEYHTVVSGECARHVQQMPSDQDCCS
jgi:hypothetical protein